MDTNEHEDKENQSNRRLTQMYADKFWEVTAPGLAKPYLRKSVFICGSPLLHLYFRVHSCPFAVVF
jgi:hypothetical protein